MKKINLYFPKILLTALFIFLFTGTVFCFLIQNRIFTTSAFATVTEQQALDEKAYTALENYFTSRSNSTGIPPEVYLNAVSKDDLKQDILSSVSQAFDYLNHQTDEYHFTMDFTKLETSVTDFFNQYAEKNGFQKDAIFQEKLNANIQEAEKEILFVADTFKFSTLYENGWLVRIRRYYTAFRTGILILCGIAILFLAGLIFCCKTEFSELCYWLGLSGLISGLLISVPCLYLLKTDYYSGFVVKDPQIFSAVVGYLQYATKQAETAFLIILILGILLLILFGVLSGISHKKATVS